ncbi:MAG: prepilin-type N-terminal cleavage/methylation domain-containing protein [Pirellulales bacterium]|nr:prepilin-type N-terminal cleavage/methylation domain-containing protein [Pirellulales bacterium]
MKLCKHRFAFTLVEVLIVVVILAILAATVIPQFTDSTTDAKKSSLRYNLHTLRAQIELYKAQHGGTPPTLSGGTLAQLTSKTDASGTIGTGATHIYGPYLVGAFPKNPMYDVATVTATATAPPSAESGTNGWLYHAATGQIFADDDDYLSY